MLLGQFVYPYSILLENSHDHKSDYFIDLVETAPHPNLAAGVHHIAEIIPTVLAAHGLAADSEQPTAANMAADFEVMIAALESALTI
jgi:hypothetical protein